MKTGVLVIQVMADARKIQTEEGISWKHQAYVSGTGPYPTPIDVKRVGSDPYAPGFYILPAGSVMQRAESFSNGGKSGSYIGTRLNLAAVDLVPLASAIDDLQRFAGEVGGAASPAVSRPRVAAVG